MKTTAYPSHPVTPSPTSMRRTLPLVIATALAVCCSVFGQTAPICKETSVPKRDNDMPPGYEAFLNGQIGVSLMKPAGWQVYCANGMILLKPSRDNPQHVMLYPLFRVTPNANGLAFLQGLCAQLTAAFPDTVVESKQSNSDGSLCLVRVAYGAQRGAATRALCLVSRGQGTGLYCCYQAPANQFDPQASALWAAIRSLKVESATFYKAACGANGFTTEQAVGSPALMNAPTIDISQLRMVASDSGTMFMAVPPGWTVGGGNVSLVATSPDGRMGVTSTHDHTPRTLDVRTYLLNYLMPFYRCTNTTITHQERDDPLIRSQAALGLPTNAVRFRGATIHSTGIPINYAMLVYATQTSAVSGYVGTLGFYATPDLFERNMVVLYCMASSMQPNRELCMANLKSNLDRLAAASRTISQTGDVVSQAIRSSTANINRAFDKYNYYLSGEEARYSPSENRIFVVDSRLGQYAVNPRNPHETLTEVPADKWGLPHERR